MNLPTAEAPEPNMHRFHLPPGQCQGDELALTGPEAHHALHVLRLRPDDPVVVLDGAGGQYHARIAALDRHSLRLQVHQKHQVPPRPYRLTLIQALPKGKGFDAIIQKAVELGVHRLVPLLSARVVAHFDLTHADRKLEHWRSIAIEAIKQSGSSWLPGIEPPLTPAEFLNRHEPFDLSLLASLQPGSRHPRECLDHYRSRHQSLPRSLGMWIGPEGDFTLEEIESIRVGGAQPVTLGPLTLRVETAAIYCLSILNYELQAPDPSPAGAALPRD